MSKYFVRDRQGNIIGWCAYPADDTDQTPIDENSQEWLDYLASMENTVPSVVSRFQALAALMQAGLLDAVQAWADDTDTDPLHRLAFTTATEFHRDSPTLAAGAAALGWSDAQLDALFIAAASIKA